MPNDAKLGFVVGVGLVMVVAVVYFRKDPTANVSSLQPPSQIVRPAAVDGGDSRTTAAPVSRKRGPSVVGSDFIPASATKLEKGDTADPPSR